MAKVMLAEDDPTMVNLLMTLLKMDGFEVVTLDAHEDVPAAVQREYPDALLLDVHLSNQSGLQILDVIRGSDATRAVHVIMISGLNLRDECLKHGADGFLLKPFMPEELVKLLKRSIGGT